MLDGQAAVITAEGEDISAQFLSGAYRPWSWCNITASALPCSRPTAHRAAICWTYDGTFSGVKVTWWGVRTAALLRRHEVQVFSELELAERRGVALKADDPHVNQCGSEACSRKRCVKQHYRRLASAFASKLPGGFPRVGGDSKLRHSANPTSHFFSSASGHPPGSAQRTFRLA